MAVSFLAIFTIGLFAVPGVFAETIVTNALGSSTPGCQETDDCFIPSTVTIDVGETITWENTDTAAHVVESGTPVDGASGVFNSSLIMAGSSFSFTFEEAGTHPYFCQVHPWMIGTVVVGDGTTLEQETSIPSWIKNNAGWWADGSINDTSFLQGISYLIQNNIIVVPSTESGTGGGEVPAWVKNTAGWWATDQIDDEAFVNAITYLIQQGLIQA